MQVQVCKIEVITPGMVGDSSDENWFRRTVVRTFKISGETYEDIEASANLLLRAYLEANPGRIGTWTLSTWVR